MAKKVLNLDALAPTKDAARELQLGGKVYPIEPMTVSNFIQTTLAAEALADEKSLAKQITATIDMICRSVPTLPREKLEGRTLENLSVIASFVRGADVAEATETTEKDSSGK